MAQKKVLVQVIYPSCFEERLCVPSLCLHDESLNCLKEHGYYLGCNGIMLVEYTFDDVLSLFHRSAVCRVVNGKYIDYTDLLNQRKFLCDFSFANSLK